MPIVSAINSDEENIKILEGALLTLVRKDFASLKKFYTWFQGHLEEDLVEIDAQDPSIKFAIPALSQIFQRFYSVQLKQDVTINEKGQQEKNLMTVNLPIQTLIFLLQDNSVSTRPILNSISVELVKYVRHFYAVDMEKDSRDRFRSLVTNLFQMVASEINCFWTALRSLLQKEVQNLDENSLNGVTAIDLIIFTLSELQTALFSQLPEQDGSKAL